jgi:Nucleotidyl transferase AbiEii toxin, Type IV TA system
MLSSKGIITELQREILHVFAAVPDASSFYLSGGTALADFFLAHRKSFDLDLFTAEEGLTLLFRASLKTLCSGVYR